MKLPKQAKEVAYSLLHYYHIMQDSIESLVLSCFSRYLSEYLTETTIACLSYWIAEIISIAITIRIAIWLWQGLGYVMQQIIKLMFTKTAEGAEFLFKQFFIRIFSTIGWFFSAIGSGLKKLFS